MVNEQHLNELNEDSESPIVSRILNSDLNALEGLIQSYNLSGDGADRSDKDWDKEFEKGPWDQGHWANRK